MRRRSGCGHVLWRMGLLSVLFSLLVAGLLLGAIAAPDSPVAALLAGLTSLLNPYAQFDPDEFVFDYTLGAEVPRVYYLSIPRLALEAPVVAVSARASSREGSSFSQLTVPNAFAVGWSSDSAPVGKPGNTVLVGHNNEYGEVFKGLWDLKAGDLVVVRTATGSREYAVSEVLMFQELGMPLETRLHNARWLNQTEDERLTMITCWPYYSNTHRTVVVALPVR